MTEISELQKELQNLDETLYTASLKMSHLSEYISNFNILFDGCRNSGYHNFDTSGQLFCRVRTWEDYKGYSSLENLWFPPKDIWLPGRLNNPHQRMLYASLDTRTALIEKSPNNSETATILTFRLKSAFVKCMELGASIIERRKLQSERDEVLFNYIVNKCKKRVPKGKEYLYAPTISYAHAFSAAEFEAIIYDSVAANYSGVNIAFYPDYIKNNLQFVQARNVVIYNKKSADDFHIKCLSQCDNLTKDANFDFKEIQGCKGHHILADTDIH